MSFESPENEIVLIGLANDYYRLVDRSDWDGMGNLFSESIRYRRNNLVLEGREQLVGFYMNDRKLSGNHTVSSLIYNPDNNSVLVKGSFIGTDDGEEVNFEFTDEFTFDENNQIIERTTNY